jgi:Amt family ammonium transporter
LAAILVSSDLGVFSGNGYGEGMNMSTQLGVQITGIIVTAIYTAIVTFWLIKLVSLMTNGIRVSQDGEQVGLDITDHEEKGYSM